MEFEAPIRLKCMSYCLHLDLSTLAAGRVGLVGDLKLTFGGVTSASEHLKVLSEEIELFDILLPRFGSSATPLRIICAAGDFGPLAVGRRLPGARRGWPLARRALA